MALKDTFQKIPVTIFKVFKSLVRGVSYVKTADDGFTAPVVTAVPIDALIISTTGIDVTRLSFYHLIQPLDKLCYLKGVDVSFEVKNGDRILDGTDAFEVKAFDVDAAGALYTLLVRGIL